MLIGWLFRLIFEGLVSLAGWLLEASEGRPVLNVLARAFALVVVVVLSLALGAITIGAVIGFFWLIVWRQVLAHVPWGEATWWMWLAGALPLILLVVGLFGQALHSDSRGGSGAASTAGE